jgi:hypothetical protein
VNRLVIASAGCFGREVLDIVEAANTVDPIFAFLGYVDNSDNPNLGLLAREVLHFSALLMRWRGSTQISWSESVRSHSFRSS